MTDDEIKSLTDTIDQIRTPPGIAGSLKDGINQLVCELKTARRGSALTPAEGAILQCLGEAWNVFSEMVVRRDFRRDDVDDFRQAIHSCQRIVMAQVAVRTNPEFFKR